MRRGSDVRSTLDAPRHSVTYIPTACGDNFVRFADTGWRICGMPLTDDGWEWEERGPGHVLITDVRRNCALRLASMSGVGFRGWFAELVDV